MKIFKFGGASVKDAEAVQNVARIIRRYQGEPLVVVVSAMGKTTNALEGVVQAYISGDADLLAKAEAVLQYHRAIMHALGTLSGNGVERIEALMQAFLHRLDVPHSDNYDYDYDQIVSYGELISTAIVGAYLVQSGVLNTWADARDLIRTDNTYREGRIKWEKTASLVQAAWNAIPVHAGSAHVMITQGFIGHTDERNTTTLGREGSDFTASILAWCLGAESVTIWKDVSGVLNADPKYFSEAVLLRHISYREAIELAYYGATVMHPKTIKPLQNKGIPLYVRSFTDPSAEGTEIGASTFSDSLMPSYIFKVNQVLISFSPRDFSFIAEDHLEELFSHFAEMHLRIRLMQNSALNFSVCTDYDTAKLEALMGRCQGSYEVLYNAPCELLTIRHYDQDTIHRLLKGKKVLVEQRSRSTARMVMVEEG